MAEWGARLVSQRSLDQPPALPVFGFGLVSVRCCCGVVFVSCFHWFLSLSVVLCCVWCFCLVRFDRKQTKGRHRADEKQTKRRQKADTHRQTTDNTQTHSRQTQTHSRHKPGNQQTESSNMRGVRVRPWVEPQTRTAKKACKYATAPVCTLSQNGYGDSGVTPLEGS